MHRDARIAALETSFAETEKILADARVERLAHLDEVHQAHRRAAELEVKYVTRFYSRMHLIEFLWMYIYIRNLVDSSSNAVRDQLS